MGVLKIVEPDLIHRNVIIAIMLAVLALLPCSAAADNIYKYQDENGIWHFTDRAPDAGVDFEIT